ncbi:MAG TPA: hypothetical protein VHX38_14410 [Pseudonocardiaceae bacterium]|nr:hypothetical protein [Pseudonocardiaceae bacterium]
MTAGSQDEPGRSGGSGESDSSAASGSSADERLCRCGHPRAAHRHYRKGSDCALCPAGGCARFRAVDGGWRGLFRKRS